MAYYLWEREGWYSDGVILVEADDEAAARTRAWQGVFDLTYQQYREWHPSHAPEQMEFYAKQEADRVMDCVLVHKPKVLTAPLFFFKQQVD